MAGASNSSLCSLIVKSRFFFTAIFLLMVVGIGIVAWNRIFSEAKEPATSQPNNKVTSAPYSRPENQKPREQERATPVEAGFVYLLSHDPMRVKKIMDDINTALASGDLGAVSRAFSMAAYNRGFKNSELQEAFKPFLNNANPSVRFFAAQSLYLTGDSSGKNTLIVIMQSPNPLIRDGVDQRILAAQTLAKYREKSTTSQIVNLYNETRDGSLLSSLALLGVRFPGAEKFPYVSRENALTEYGLVEARDLVPKIRNTFESSKDAQTLLGAARSLAQMTGEPRYLDYLVAVAQSAVANQLPYSDTSKAIKYLGSIDSPLSREVLQAGLQSENAEVVQYSAINLLFNQTGGYEPVKERLLHELDLANVKDFKLGEELKWHLVTVMSDDPEISQSAQAYSKRTQLFDWEYNVVERKKWPIYNWIDNYVVRLNRATPQR